MMIGMGTVATLCYESAREANLAAMAFLCSQTALANVAEGAYIPDYCFDDFEVTQREDGCWQYSMKGQRYTASGKLVPLDGPYTTTTWILPAAIGAAVLLLLLLTGGKS